MRLFTLAGIQSLRSPIHNFIYKCLEEGCVRDHSLPVEIMPPVSIYKKHIETFLMVRKQMRYSETVEKVPKSTFLVP